MQTLFVDNDGGSIFVENEELVFRSGRADDILGTDSRFNLGSLVSIGNHASKQLWEPDALYLVYRDSEGKLDHFVWALIRKGVSREVSNAIYPFIKAGIKGSFLGLAYTLTHRVVLPGQM